MLSIITSIHNQLGMNKLFYETLIRNTSLPFELIIIDNNSTDGSKEFFKDKAKLIENKSNYSYSYCQNQGIKIAQYDYLVFLNNDLLVSKNWDTRIVEILKQNSLLQVVSFATNNRLESVLATKKISRRWKRIKYPLLKTLGSGYRSLKWMAKLMYGAFEDYTERRWLTFENKLMEGFSGSAILIRKEALEKIGLWDERIYAADFDLYCRTKKRSLENNDMLPIHIALGIYFHHFQRLTLKSNYKPFADADKLIPLDEKWAGEDKQLLSGIDK